MADQPAADQPVAAVLATAALAAVALAACSPAPAAHPPVPPTPSAPPVSLLRGYFAALNDAGARGPAAQSAFLRATQHPRFTDRFCDNGQFTYTEEPAWSTVRADRQWAPDGATPPSGAVYAVAVLLTARHDGEVTATQIGTVRIAVLGGRVYGFSPCTSPGG